MIPIVLTSSLKYYPGLLALLYSLEANGNLPENQKIIILLWDNFTSLEKKVIEEFNFDFEFINFSALPDYGPIAPVPMAIGKTFNNIMFYRYMLPLLIVFHPAVVGGKAIYLDTDMICIGDISEAFDMEPISAAPDYSSTNEPVYIYEDKRMFTNGFMVYETSLEDYNGMVEHFQRNAEKIMVPPSGDQAVINSYFYHHYPEKIHLLGQEWNITKRVMEGNPQWANDLMKIGKFLHYVGGKVWIKSDFESDKKQDYWPMYEIWFDYWERTKERLGV